MSKNNKKEFDKYSKNYKKVLKNSFPKLLRNIDYYSEYKVQKVFNLRKKLNTKSIMDFGCGIGLSHNFFFKYFPKIKLWGFDESLYSLKEAKKNNKNVMIVNNLKKIPKNYFDVIFVSNVFHHIDEKNHKNTLLHLKLFLKPNGSIYIFEHNKFNPITKIIFSTHILDKNAKMVPVQNFYKLAKNCEMKLIKKKYILFFPSILSFFNILDSILAWLPLGAQYLIILKKN